LAEREHLQGATILEVSVLPHPEPQWPSPAARPLPRVLVRQSSGSRKLDDLAVQGIHAFIAQQRSENRTADKKTRNDGGSWLLKIDWRFPSQPERDRPEQNDGGQK